MRTEKQEDERGGGRDTMTVMTTICQQLLTHAPASLHLERRPDKMFFLRRLAGMATVSPSAEPLPPLAHPHLNLWRPSVKCAGHGKREIIWDKLPPQWTSHPRLLRLHISSGHLSARTPCSGGGRYCSIKNRLQHLALPVQADIRLQYEPDNPLTSHKACASCGQSHICELISAEMCLHAGGSSWNWAKSSKETLGQQTGSRIRAFFTGGNAE